MITKHLGQKKQTKNRTPLIFENFINTKKSLIFRNTL